MGTGTSKDKATLSSQILNVFVLDVPGRTLLSSKVFFALGTVSYAKAHYK